MDTKRRRPAAPDQLSAIFGALADPTRRAILDRLRKRPHSVTELAAPFDMTQPSISKHLKVLEQAGLVVRGKDAQLRPRALESKPLRDANAYLERFRALWEARLDRLESYLAMRPLAILLVLACLASLATPAGAQPLPDLTPYLATDRAAEVALARTAAPRGISDSATVLVLTRTKFVEAAHGTNGFTCLVLRSFSGSVNDSAFMKDPGFWNPHVRSPICFNPPAARTVLPAMLANVEWLLTGTPPAEAAARARRAYAAHQFPTPAPGAMAYMLSPQQYLVDADPHHWMPHLMFFFDRTFPPAAWGAS
ncbi:MAG TPA: metalloregulator ArsR/SmtB family transcription factor, partial [Gemmatimonadaceae bacterium]|nr:metalloregulator ArsR/SmtB family transcription factor [Gemmatimonadaceae bacterium]